MDRRTRAMLEDMTVGSYVIPSTMNPSKARGISGMILALKGRLFRLMDDMKDVLEGRYVRSDPELVELAKKVTLAYENSFKPALLALETRAQQKSRDNPK